MPDVSAIVVVESEAGVDKSLIGCIATGKSQGFRITNVDVGEVLTHIMLIDPTKIL